MKIRPHDGLSRLDFYRWQAHVRTFVIWWWCYKKIEIKRYPYEFMDVINEACPSFALSFVHATHCHMWRERGSHNPEWSVCDNMAPLVTSDQQRKNDQMRSQITSNLAYNSDRYRFVCKFSDFDRMSDVARGIEL